MLSDSIMRHPRRSVLIALALLIVLAIVLLNLPVAELVNRFAASHDLLQRAVNGRVKLFIAALAAAAISAAVLAAVRRYRLFMALVSVALPLFVLYGVYEFQTRYPNAAVFNSVRLHDGLAIVLGVDAPLSKYHPVPTLHLPRKRVEQAAYPAIDVHFHFESLPPHIDADRLIRAMDATNVAKLINMGGTRELFEHFATTFHARYPDRFVMFTKLDLGAVAKPGGVQEIVQWIDDAARMGAVGIGEINKSLGTWFRDPEGKLLKVDDPRLDPIWDEAARLGMPVLVHTGDPPSFWDSIDVQNERYLELLQTPEWSLYGKNVPTRKELMQQRERLLARHPGTNFVGAHFGMNPDDLEYAAHLFDTYPNYYIDMSSVVQELGREPYSTRRFFTKYQDRILYGTDGGADFALDGDGWTPERYFRSHFEFLETDNEYIEYPMADITKQGTWRVYGINLPPEVLEKIYQKNAERLIPSHVEVLRRLDGLEQSTGATHASQ